MRSRLARIALTAMLALGCAPGPASPPPACESAEPVDLSEGSVRLATHAPAGSASVRGTVVRNDFTATGIELDVDVGGVLHEFRVPGDGNGVPVSVGDTVSVEHSESIEATSSRTDLAVEDEAGHLVAVFVRASGEHDVSAVVTETAARFGVAASARRACLTDGGACGRRGARYEIVTAEQSARQIHATTADGFDLDMIGWRLESDDTAEWSGAPTCDAPPRASIVIEARAFPPLGPPPPACEGPPAISLGYGTAPVGAPPIVHTPDSGAVSGAATVVSIGSSDPMSIVLDVGGTEHAFEVPLATIAPALAPGASVWVEYAGDDAGSFGTGRETLVLRESEGGPGLAAYVRARGYGWLGAGETLSEAFDMPATVTAACRLDAGGQCGRGLIVRALSIGGVRVGEGESADVARDGAASVRVAVHGLADDADAWPAGSVCAIGALVAEAVDAAVLP